jgi:cytochrome b561
VRTGPEDWHGAVDAIIPARGARPRDARAVARALDRPFALATESDDDVRTAIDGASEDVDHPDRIRRGGRGVRAPLEFAYTRTAIVLHWLSGLLILCGFALGVWMVNQPIAPSTLRAYGYHKWIGITVFLVAAGRVAWRWGHPPPPPVAMPVWQRRAAALTHVLLYALMLAIPLSGWLYSSATGVEVVYLGLVPLPDLVPKDKALAAVLKTAHYALNFTLLALVVVHTGAALKHHLVDRDGVLLRMLPRRARRLPERRR